MQRCDWKLAGHPLVLVAEGGGTSVIACDTVPSAEAPVEIDLNNISESDSNSSRSEARLLPQFHNSTIPQFGY